MYARFIVHVTCGVCLLPWQNPTYDYSDHPGNKLKVAQLMLEDEVRNDAHGVSYSGDGAGMATVMHCSGTVNPNPNAAVLKVSSMNYRCGAPWGDWAPLDKHSWQGQIGNPLEPDEPGRTHDPKMSKNNLERDSGSGVQMGTRKVHAWNREPPKRGVDEFLSYFGKTQQQQQLAAPATGGSTQPPSTGRSQASRRSEAPRTGYTGGGSTRRTDRSQSTPLNRALKPGAKQVQRRFNAV